MPERETHIEQSVESKALTINLNPLIYGTFAEIGAGQEVARNFFRAGGAAGTVAKTMSAYDMKFSDEIYGKSTRYVSPDRVLAMLDHEYRLLIERLNASRGPSSTFFVYANTVSARNYAGTNECHGWMGVRFQAAPMEEPSDVLMHVRMLDAQALLQQQAIGIVGVNLLYAAYYFRGNGDSFVRSLLDELSSERIEVDLLEFSGPAFEGFDNRLMSLRLVEHHLTPAVMFGPGARVLQPSEVLYKKPVLFERGRFRPITKVHIDMLACAEKQFTAKLKVQHTELVVLAELSLTSVLESNKRRHEDLLVRVDTINALGLTALVTNFPEFYRLPAYLRRYTKEPIAVTLGINALLQLFDERFYAKMEGGILEAFGRLFHQGLHAYVYPMSALGYERLVHKVGLGSASPQLESDGVVSTYDMLVPHHLRHLFKYLRETGALEPITGFDRSVLDIVPQTVLELIRADDGAWRELVPSAAVPVIEAHRAVFEAV